MRHEAEQAAQNAFDAFTREDVSTVIRETRRAADLYAQTGDTDKQFQTLTTWVGFVGARDPEAAQRLLSDAERLLPTLQGADLAPIHQHTYFFLTPDPGLPDWPDDPYQQRITEVERLKILLSLSASSK